MINVILTLMSEYVTVRVCYQGNPCRYAYEVKLQNEEITGSYAGQMAGIERFLDNEGPLKQWPSKQADKVSALGYLASKFQGERGYSEREVNDILKSWHVFRDWPLLRRELVDRGYLGRTVSGSKYRVSS
jgi:hypothetical protein